MQPKYDVFISHANEDSEKSIELYNALKAEGISCWLDKISGIVDYTLDIPTAVESSLILILLASKSANRPRGGVITECTIALDRDVDVPIHSILIENVQLIELRNLRYFLSSPVERLHAFSHTQAKPVQEIARIIASRVNQIKSENAFIEDISIINQQEVKSTSVVGRAKQPEKTPTLPMAQGKATPQFSKAQLTAEQSNEKLKEALGMDRNPIKGKSILAAIHGGATNFSLTDKLGRTALHWAAMKGDAEAIKIVLAGDSDINALTQDEKTPLDLATENGFKEVAALLANAQLKSALSLGQGRSKGESKSEQILRAVRGGVTDFSLTDKAGRTALHWAAMKDDDQAAKIALEGGADANAVSNLKQTPLDLAREKEATKTVALLSAPAKDRPWIAKISRAGANEFDIYISHSSKDKAQANLLWKTLKKRGYKCWIAPESINSGEDWITSIKRGVENSAVFALLFSSNSDVSGEVRSEVAFAKECGTKVVSIQLESVRPEYQLKYFIWDKQWISADKGTFATQVERVTDELEKVLQTDNATVATSKVEPLKTQAYTAQPKYDAYIVCSPLNEYFAEQLEASLNREGIRVFLALGKEQNIISLKDSRLMLLVASSPTLGSPAARNAIESAQQSGIPIVAGRIDSNPNSYSSQLGDAIWVDEKRDQSPENLAAIVAAVQAKLKSSEVQPTQAAKTPVQSAPIGGGENWYSVNGVESLRSKKASEVVANALRELAQLAPQFLGDVEKQVLDRKGDKVQKRRWLARTKEELYLNPEFHNHSVEIIPGWWLGTNYSNDNKREMLAVAREVASKLGIEFDFQLA